MRNISILLVFFFLASCAAKRKTAYTDKVDSLDIAEAFLGMDYSVAKSPENTYRLYYAAQQKGPGAIKNTKYFITDRSMSEVSKGSFNGERIEWLDETHILIYQIMGIASPSDNGLKKYSIDIKTGNKEEITRSNDE